MRPQNLRFKIDNVSVCCRMVVTGYKKSLVREDLWHLNPEDRSQSVVPKFEIQWNKEVLKSQR